MKKEILVVFPHTPEPDGPAGDRAAYRLLRWLAGAARLSCVAQSPPLSSQILRAGLASKGIELLDGASSGPAAAHARVHQAVRGRRFDAVVLVGPAAVSRWARPLRLLIPRQLLFCFFPDAAALRKPLERFSAAARQGVKGRWRNLLSLADGIWLRSEKEARSVARCFSLNPEKFDVLPADRGAAEGRWLSSCMAKRAGPRRVFPKRVEIVCFDMAAEGARGMAAAGRVAGRRPRIRFVEGGAGGLEVRRLNRILKSGRGDFSLICLHPLRSSENLVRTLVEGMHVLPYAGAAVPLEFSALRPGLGGGLPMKEGLFSAAWALKNKGDWHEVDYPSHVCCLLLRRDAWEAVGLLDARFQSLKYAWIDYFLRLQQEGRPVLLAQDALAFCSQKTKRGGGGFQDREADDRDLLVEKWCKGSLKLMESLLASLEPNGYRADSGMAEPDSSTMGRIPCSKKRN